MWTEYPNWFSNSEGHKGQISGRTTRRPRGAVLRTTSRSPRRRSGTSSPCSPWLVASRSTGRRNSPNWPRLLRPPCPTGHRSECMAGTTIPSIAPSLTARRSGDGGCSVDGPDDRDEGMGVVRWRRRRQRTDDAAANPFRAFGTVTSVRFFFGQLPSASGTFLQQTALGWLVFQQTGSAASLGMVLASGSLPALLLGPWGGAFADRFDLRRLLLVTQVALAVFAGTLWVAVFTGAASHRVHRVPQRGQRLGIGGRWSGATGLRRPAGAGRRSGQRRQPQRRHHERRQGDRPRHRRDLDSHGRHHAVFRGQRVVLSCRSSPPCSRSRRRRGVGGGRASGGVREGLRYARGRHQLWLPLAMMAVDRLVRRSTSPWCYRSSPRVTSAPPAVPMACLTAALSVGSVLGSLLVGRIAHPKRIYLAVASLLFGVAMGITAMTTTVAAAAVALALTGVAAFVFVTLTSTTLQLHSSPPYRARIMALYGFFYLGTTPVGSMVVGWICQTVRRSCRPRRRRDRLPDRRRIGVPRAHPAASRRSVG